LKNKDIIKCDVYYSYLYTYDFLLMHLKIVIVLIVSVFNSPVMSQIQPENDLPFDQIPDYPDYYSAGTTAARIIDGLGFRYYWATEGLRKEDLLFKPNEDVRTSEATLDHILSLCLIIVHTAKQIPYEGFDASDINFEDKRRLTLESLKDARDIFMNCSDEDMESYKVVFKSGDKLTQYPFWNLINGPISDALWHVGQIVSFRRSSGNPFTNKISVFHGKMRE
jgi:hypothetical protein